MILKNIIVMVLVKKIKLTGHLQRMAGRKFMILEADKAGISLYPVFPIRSVPLGKK